MDRSLVTVMNDFRGVRKQTIRRVGEFPEQDLNDAGRFAWSGGRPLWEWIAGDSYEHESEHQAEIRAWLSAR